MLEAQLGLPFLLKVRYIHVETQSQGKMAYFPGVAIWGETIIFLFNNNDYIVK